MVDSKHLNFHFCKALVFCFILSGFFNFINLTIMFLSSVNICTLFSFSLLGDNKMFVSWIISDHHLVKILLGDFISC